MKLHPVLVLALAVLVSACAGDPNPVPGPTLAAPDARAMRGCGRLPDGPEHDGDPAVRAAYETDVRAQYVECRSRHAQLRAYITAIRR